MSFFQKGKVIKRKIPRDGAIVVESFQSKTDHTKNIRIVVFATKIVVYILEGCNDGRLVQRISDVTRSKILRNCCFIDVLRISFKCMPFLAHTV